MFRLLKVKIFFTGLAALGMIMSAHAAVMVYDNETDYENAVGTSLFSIDFNNNNPAALVDGSTINTNVVFSSPEASDPSKVLWFNNALADAGSTIAANNNGPLALDFTDDIFGFSLDFSSSQNQQTIELYDSTDNLISSVLSPTANGFFGVSSDTLISSAVIINGIFSSTGGPDRFFIDNLQANAASSVPTSIPTPATLALLVFGLLGFCFKSRN